MNAVLVAKKRLKLYRCKRNKTVYGMITLKCHNFVNLGLNNDLIYLFF